MDWPRLSHHVDVPTQEVNNAFTLSRSSTSTIPKKTTTTNAFKPGNRDDNGHTPTKSPLVRDHLHFFHLTTTTTSSAQPQLTTTIATMPSNAANPPLPPGKRTSIVPYKGKYFCCSNVPFTGLEQAEKTRDGNARTPEPITNITGDLTTSSTNLVHFFKWASLYFDGTPPLQSYKEMDINTKTWFIQVKQLKSGAERYFFPELGSTPFSQLTYSFLEVTNEDLTFPDKEVEKCAGLAIMCCFPRKKFVEDCPEQKKPHNMRNGRAFEVSIWKRESNGLKKLKEDLEMSKEKFKNKGNKGKAKVECVVPPDQISDSSDEANNEDRLLNLKALNEMLKLSVEDQKVKADKVLQTYMENEAKFEAKLEAEAKAKKSKENVKGEEDLLK